VGDLLYRKKQKQWQKFLMADKKLPVKQICDRLGIAKSTLYKYAAG